MNNFDEHLSKYGPSASYQTPSFKQADLYCQELTQNHYENFTVASWLLPKTLRPHFNAIYSYCRWADDLADEVSGEDKSMRLLSWWQDELDCCYAGKVQHPVFVALQKTIHNFSIPIDPFQNLLSAFKQDQHVHQYKSTEQLLAYCENSANPVGHLVLYLGRCFNHQTKEFSDSICTGLQLINFWQDVARDYQIGRIYLPQEELRRFEVTEDMLTHKKASTEFRQLLEQQVIEAEKYLLTGVPLIELVSKELKLEISLFIRGGLAIAAEIRKQQFDVLMARPQVSKWRKIKLLATAWLNPSGIKT